MIVKSVSLHNDKIDRDGKKHDKVYYLQIVDGSKPNTYTVAFQYGKRGGSLKWGNRDGSQKVEDCSLWQAEDYMAKKVKEQEKKGYHIIPDPDDILTLIGFTF
jgi:hypothetical protein